MPISINEFASPRWTKMRTRYPWTDEVNYRYRNLTINPRNNLDRYNRNRDTEYGWKLPGYNPNHNSTKIEQINLGVDTSSRSFKPY